MKYEELKIVTTGEFLLNEILKELKRINPPEEEVIEDKKKPILNGKKVSKK